MYMAFSALLYSTIKLLYNYFEQITRYENPDLDCWIATFKLVRQLLTLALCSKLPIMFCKYLYVDEASGVTSISGRTNQKSLGMAYNV